jgi:hypothetical protein
MTQQIVERRRLLQLFALGAIAVPAAALAGCAQGTRTTRPPRRYGGGGNRGGEKSGGSGGAGTAGGRR